MTRATMAAGLAAVAIGAGVIGAELAPCHPVTTPAAPIVPCATEDSAGPCYWDASTRGNGHGRSFIVDGTGTVHYLAGQEAGR